MFSSLNYKLHFLKKNFLWHFPSKLQFHDNQTVQSLLACIHVECLHRWKFLFFNDVFYSAKKLIHTMLIKSGSPNNRCNLVFLSWFHFDVFCKILFYIFSADFSSSLACHYVSVTEIQRTWVTLEGETATFGKKSRLIFHWFCLILYESYIELITWIFVYFSSCLN